MSDTGSPDHFFSALEILSDVAVSASASPDRVNHEAPTYADDSILICSLPETPLSSASTPPALIDTIVPTKQTTDPLNSNGFHALPTRMPRSVVSRRSMGAKIRSYDSEEENVNPSFGPDTSTVSGHSKDVGESKEEQKFTFLDVLKLLSEKPNERFKDTDILEVAAMKGIRFPPPRWWKPGAAMEPRKHR